MRIRRLQARVVAWTLLVIAGTGAVGLALFVMLGVYDVSAIRQHLAPTYAVLELAVRRAVSVRADAIVAPPLDDPTLQQRGLALFHVHCAQCHGAPGVAPAPFALGLTPAATNLADDARKRPARELYWVIRNGLKMTAMPAWQFRLSERDLWATVAFVQQLPKFSPEHYRARIAVLPALAAVDALSAEPPTPVADPQRGKLAVQQYACATCHQIPGIVGAQAPVGPTLERLRWRGLLSGTLPNTPENLVQWLRDPQAVDPLSAMPNLQVSERDARDIAAFLWTLE